MRVRVLGMTPLPPVWALLRHRPFTMLLLLSMGLACQRVVTQSPSVEWQSYAYADGSGNVWTLTREDATLRYQPVTMDDSSSGTYSGGTALIRSLDGREIERLVAVLENAIRREEIRIEERVKMSGVVERRDARGRKRVIIRPGCAEQIRIENLLHAAGR